MATKAKTSVSKEVPSILNFSASSYMPTDIFTNSSSVPYTNQSDFDHRLEQIKGQIRSVELAQQNFILAKQLIKAEGYAIDARNEVKKNLIKLENGVTLDVQLTQAETHTAIERAKLAELNHDLSGHNKQAALRESVWNLKIEGLEADIERAKKLLALKKEEIKMIG